MESYKHVALKDWPEDWLFPVMDAVDWLQLEGIEAKSRLTFKNNRMNPVLARYFPQWNTISIYSVEDFIDPLVVHELTHAWQEVFGIPEKYELEFPAGDTSYSRYLLSSQELHAYHVEYRYRKHKGYPEPSTTHEYLKWGISLEEL